MTRLRLSLAAILLVAGGLPVLVGCSAQSGSTPGQGVPPTYASKHMPAGWWDDPSVVEEGRALYLGQKHPDVNCAKCHGRNGKPVKSGARDFRDTASMKRYSDSHLLWRLSEGVPFTQMRGYKDKLTEEQMWKIVAYVRTFGLEGLRYDVAAKQWVPMDGDEPAGTNKPDQERV